MSNENLEIKNFIIKWFEKKNNFKIDKKKLNLNYFDSQWLDSLDIINLVETLEKKYSISFNENHFEDRRFSTINGLSLIIITLIDEKK